MPLRNAKPLNWKPKGLSDTFDGTNAFNGAMAQLANLIPDASTDQMWIPRPAPRSLTWGAGAPAGNIVCALQVGNNVYFMAGDGAGRDIPFAYNLLTGLFVAVTGIVPAVNCPTNWTAAQVLPQMVLVGTRIVVTHPNFPGAGVMVGWLNIVNPLIPAWAAGTTAVNALAGIPSGVAQMTNRAWYIVGNALEASDVNDPTTRTNANQVVTVGDSIAVTALKGLPLSAQQGGIIQSLIAFKGDQVMYQITGDFTTTNIASNALNIATGTNSPGSVTPTPIGLMFVSPDGVRFIDFNAIASPPIGDAGMGISLPFIYALQINRIIASCNADTIRITVQNGKAIGTPFQEFWYDFSRKIWSGPHDDPANVICTFGSAFLIAPQADPTKLYISDAYPTLTPAFVQFGTPMSFNYQTVLLPDTNAMAENAMMESAVMVSLPFGSDLTVACLDEQNSVLDQVTISSVAALPSIWGIFVWGIGLWGSVAGLGQRRIPWSKPLVFKQMSILITGKSADGVRIENLYLKYQPLGYLLQDPTP